LEGLLSTLKDAETGQRGYLLTGDPSYLQPHNEAAARVRDELAQLKLLTEDDAGAPARLSALQPPIEARMAELAHTVALRKQGKLPAALRIVQRNTGKDLMERVRAGVAEMEDAQREALRQRAADSRESIRTTLLSIVTFLVAGP